MMVNELAEMIRDWDKLNKIKQLILIGENGAVRNIELKDERG